MSSWIVVAHVLGAAVIGALDAARLGVSAIGLAVVPLFAALGLLAGLVVAGTERLAAKRPWWQAALIRGAPSLIVLGPMASTLFDGAYAQTLPAVRALPYLVPLAGWLVTAGAIALGRMLLRERDLTSRSIVLLGAAGALGGIVWAERHVLGGGYPGAHVAATIAVAVLAGVAIRVLARPAVPAYLAAALAALSIGTAAAATLHGLADPNARAVLAAYGDQGRDLVRLVRQLVDRDGDGSSPLLGGGDCDDGDASRHPGAADTPGDGIDQDCDGADAPVPPPAPPAAPSADLATWRASPEIQALLARTRGMNVLLVTVDALRFDMLAPDAPDRGEFPNLVKLLDESAWFTRAISPASGTDVSLGTLLTGRFDPYQTIETTLPEAIQGLGHRTYSALPAEVTRYVGEVLPGRGFDHARPVFTDWDTDDKGDHVSAPATTHEGIRAFDDAGGVPWFVWLHYFDVHEHHQIDIPRELLAKVHDEPSAKRHGYRALLYAIDHDIGRLRAELEQRGLADKTIILFLSDHGESLGEDPRLLETHGRVAYHTLVRVPFAIHVPGLPRGRRTDPVSLVDVAPTLLSLLGAKGAIATLDGLDLLPALVDAPAALRRPERAIVVHEETQWSVVEWPYQLIVRPADDIAELYDLAADPGEHTDLVAKLPDVVTRLRARYAEVPVVRVDRTPDGRRWREARARRPPTPAPPSGSPATTTP